MTATIHLNEFDDLLRVAGSGAAALTVGVLVLLIWRTIRLPHDTRSGVGPYVLMGFAMITLLISAAYSLYGGILGEWPLSFNDFLRGIAILASFVGAVWKFKTMAPGICKAEKTNARIRMTMTDVSRPGPDIDLLKHRKVV